MVNFIHTRPAHHHLRSATQLGFSFVIFVWASILFSTAQATTFTASTDRTELSHDEHLILTLSLLNSDTRLRAQGVQPNIDLTLLTDDFDVGTPRNKINYNIFRNQGRATSSLEVALFPKATGEFVIPSFSVDGVSTQPIHIKVLPAKYAHAPLAFSRASVSHTEVWQRQQLVVHLDVYARVALDSAKLGGPIDLSPIPLDQYEHYQLPSSERDEQVNGFTYKVKRTSWSIFPLNQGPLTLHFPDAWIVTADKQQLRLPQETLQVTVKPLPSHIDNEILVGKPSVTITPIQSSNKVGDISSWHITITAPSSFNDLPAQLPFRAPTGLRLFTDNKTDDRIDNNTGVRQVAHYTLSAVAQTQGSFRLPPVELHYFDTENGQLSSLTLDNLSLTINEGSALAQQHDGKDFSASTPTNYWPLATLVFALLWLLTLGYFLRRPALTALPPPPSKAPQAPPHQGSPRPLEAQLLNALGSRSLEQGLTHWQTQHGNHPQLEETIRQVQRFYYANNDSGLCEATLKDKVDACCRLISSTRDDIQHTDEWSPTSFTQTLKGHKAN